MNTARAMGVYWLALNLAAPAVLAQSSVLEEVVVTARKRDESFQDVPVAVNAFTEADIASAGIERPQDFIALTPNMTMVQTQNQGTSFITVRGISQARNSEPSVAVLIDGVLIANPSQFNQELYDIEQIEVLKGPQGALYGRNAIGGAITIRTKQPGDQLEGRIQVGAESGPGYKVRAGLSGPVPGMDDLNFRGSFSYFDTDGYINNPFLGDEADPFEDISGRLKLLWQPNEDFTADLRFSISEVDTQALYFNITASADDTSLPVRVNNEGRNERDMYSVSLKMDYGTDYGVLTSITSYDDLEEILTGDQFDFLPRPESFLNLDTSGFGDLIRFLTGDAVVDLNQTQFLDVQAWSQELRFTSPAENRFRWIAGGYFILTDRFISTGNMIDRGLGVFPVFRTPRPSVFSPFFGVPVTDPNPQLGLLVDSQDNFAWAVFGEISYDISDLLEGSIALRYDRDNRENTTETEPLFDPTGGLTVNGQVRKESWDSLQPKATLRFKPSDDWTLYLSYSRGFRSGGFNQSGVGGLGIPGVSDIFDQETADTIEGGIKTQWLDGRLRTNVSVYRTDAEGSYFFVFDPGTSTQNLGNVDEVAYQGFEFEAAAVVAEGLDMYLGLGYTDSEIEAHADPAAIGNEAPLVSEYTVNIGGQYVRPLPGWPGVNAFIRTDYQLIGPTYWDPPNTSVRNPVGLVDLRFGVEGETWSLTAWSRNLNDNDYNAEWSPGPAPGAHFVWKAPPRRYGLDFVKRF
ncbi:MAG: TonB-dependent receptor [Gammaproteobacteria bacterium]|nr:TonB-dependent receptor [Gammaproteobacteria bacterium]